MLLPEMRAELLRQHDEIRALIAGVRAAIARVRADGETADELRSGLRALDRALTAHNRSEEAAFQGALRSEHSGPLRTAMLSDRHRREHDHVQHALTQAVVIRDRALRARAAERVIDDVLAHMALEERDLYRDPQETAA